VLPTQQIVNDFFINMSSTRINNLFNYPKHKLQAHVFKFMSDTPSFTLRRFSMFSNLVSYIPLPWKLSGGRSEVVSGSCPAEVATPVVIRGPFPTEVVRWQTPGGLPRFDDF